MKFLCKNIHRLLLYNNGDDTSMCDYTRHGINYMIYNATCIYMIYCTCVFILLYAIIVGRA